MGEITTMAVVRFRVEGFHCWSDAEGERSYLASRHRHMFHVEVSLELYGLNREVEFHDLLGFCKEKFLGGELGSKSCEMMALHLLHHVEEQWAQREITVSVFEDGEVGATVTKYYEE